MASNKTAACPFAGLDKIEFDMTEFVYPNKPSNCTWSLTNKNTKSPHTSRPLQQRPSILPDILTTIGQTPLIKLNNIPNAEGVKCQIFAKCEFMNPGGSTKDRIGYRMVLDAEEAGILTPGCTIIEPTSGNTGVGLAMACAVKNYKCIIVMPEKMSDEKVGTLKALGAQIIRTPTEAAFDTPESLIAVAQKLKKLIPESHILDQYRNSGNPLAHYDGTGAEIIEQTNNDVDYVVLTAGTGGTLTGIGRKIKEANPSCKIIAVDPYGSSLSRPESLNETDTTFYEVEGIGYDFIPTVLDHSVADQWIKSEDLHSFKMARRLQSEEGLLCGGSSGAVVHAAIELARELDANKKVVVILPDSIRNYMSKFIVDSWLEARDLKPSVNVNGFPWWDNSVSDLLLSNPETVKVTEIVGDVINHMKNLNVEQIPLVDLRRGLKGMITRAHILNRLMNDNIPLTATIDQFIYKQFRKVKSNVNLGRISRILEREPFVVIIDTDVVNGKQFETVVGVVTKERFLDYVLDYSKNDKPKNGF